MNYNEAIDYIHSANKFGIKLGLHNITKLLEELGNPHKQMKIIHVAGTNGKGSIASMISSVLVESGYNVGLFTSPYLERFNERIKVNGKDVSDQQIASSVCIIKQKIRAMVEQGYQHPTEFEIVTALGFVIFKQAKVDFVVLEVGLGGRLDATNVVDPLICVFASISKDHMDILGDDIEKIALEKAGIIKQGCRVISYPQIKKVYQVIKSKCRQKNAILKCVENSMVKRTHFSEYRQVFDFKYGDFVLKKVVLNLIGSHQLLNAATAIVSLLTLKEYNINITSKAIRDGLKKTTWPGRLELISRKPMILIDGAHNEDGAKSLKSALNDYFKHKEIIMVIGMLKDKNVEQVAGILLPMAQTVIATTPSSVRALSADKMAYIAQKYCPNVHTVEQIEQAVTEAINICKRDQMVVFCGSFYLIGKVRTIVNMLKESNHRTYL